MRASIWATYKSKAESLVSSKARKALCIQIALRGREHLVHWNQLNACLPKGTVWQNSAFFFFWYSPPLSPPFAPFSPLSGLWKGYMKRHVGWWKWSFYIKRRRWSEQNSNGHDLSKDSDLQASQRNKVQPRISGTVLKNLSDADSCPRLGSNLGAKVNAESKSFPESTRCYSDPSEWLSCPVVEVNLCRSVENEYMFPSNIDHIQHLNLQQPTETEHQFPKVYVQYEHVSRSVHTYCINNV